MRVHVSRPVSRRPLAIAIGVSIGFHLLLLAIVLLVRPPRGAAVRPSPPVSDSRSALRRGGRAGAGGAGEGWAGIEGEPIPLDSSDPRYNDYLDRVRRMIKEKWGYPCIKDVSTGNCD